MSENEYYSSLTDPGTEKLTESLELTQRVVRDGNMVTASQVWVEDNFVQTDDDVDRKNVDNHPLLQKYCTN